MSGLQGTFTSFTLMLVATGGLFTRLDTSDNTDRIEKLEAQIILIQEDK